jgi:hypothetical protein
VTTLARTLCTLYALTALWLAWCTIQTFGHVPVWASILNFTASLTSVMAIANTSADADDMHDLHRQLEHAAQPAPKPQPTVDPPALTDAERAAFDEIEAHYRKDEAA